MTKSEIKNLKRGQTISGGGDDWCVETILKHRPAVLCRSITTNELKEIQKHDLTAYTKILNAFGGGDAEVPKEALRPEGAPAPRLPETPRRGGLRS